MSKFQIGQPVQCLMDFRIYNGVVKEIYDDHIIVDVPDISDHCWFEEGFNMDCLFLPEERIQISAEEKERSLLL